MRVMVTGAAGLLGANLVLTALARGLNVTAALHVARATFPGADHLYLDLADSAAIASTLRAVRPDWLIHCAGLTDVDWCEQHPLETERLHVAATRDLAAAAESVDCGFLQISTDSVFDGSRGNYSEEDSPNPINVYARSKLNGEAAASRAATRCLIARINLYGWNLQPKLSLGEWVLDRLSRGETVPGFADVCFNPLVATDLSEILLELTGSGTTGVIHIGGSEACSKYVFAEAIAVAFAFDPARVIESSISGKSFIASRPRDTSLNVGRLARIVRRKMPNIDHGIGQFRSSRDNGYLAKLKSCYRS